MGLADLLREIINGAETLVTVEPEGVTNAIAQGIVVQRPA